MMKFLKAISLTVLVGLMAALMVACSDATPTPASHAPANTQAANTQAASNPSGGGNFFVINGATSTNVPDALKAALAQYEVQYPGSKAQAYKVSPQAATVKDQLAGAFTKEGWQNITQLLLSHPAVSSH